MPDRIDPAVNPVEMAPFHTCCNRVPPQPRLNELSERDDAVLLLSDTDKAKVGRGAFFPHVGE